MLMSENKLELSIWGHVRTEIFEKVDEDVFNTLYSEKMGRPNTPVHTRYLINYKRDEQPFI